MHVVSQDQQVHRASYVTTCYNRIRTFLVVLRQRVAVTFVEVSCVFGFCFWLTPITPTVLCVSTCSDGLLDFRTGENINQSVELPLDKVGFEVFFCLDAAWLNEGRCRGGRPSVSEN